MRFDLTSGKTKCISEDIKSNAMTVGKYSVVNPNEGNPLPDNHKLTVKVCNCRSFGCKMHVKSPILMLICFFIFCFDVFKVVFLFLFGAWNLFENECARGFEFWCFRYFVM